MQESIGTTTNERIELFMRNDNELNNKDIDHTRIQENKAVTLDEAYADGFYSENKGGKCTKCGKSTMYAERTLCYPCYLDSKKQK